MLRKQDRKMKQKLAKKYDLGFYWNLKAVFGTNRLGWILPLPQFPMDSDGIIWIKKENLASSLIVF